MNMMNIKNFELGVLRAYYVVWAVFSIGWGFAAIYEGWWNRFEEGWGRESTTLHHLQYVGILLAVVIGPGVVMYATRWIYRGFVPKHPR